MPSFPPRSSKVTYPLQLPLPGPSSLISAISSKYVGGPIYCVNLKLVKLLGLKTSFEGDEALIRPVM